MGGLLSALFLAFALGGCSYAIVTSAGLRPDALEEIALRTSVARGIPLEGPVDVRLVTAEELAQRIEQETLAELGAARLADYQEALTAIGLWPADRGLLDEYVGVAGDEIAGFYLPDRGAIFMLRDPPVPLSLRLVSALSRRDLAREVVLSHELVHLLQHRAYPQLMEPDDLMFGQDDASSAVQAAIEGDATRYGFAALGLVPPHPRDFQRETEAAVEADGKGRLAASPGLIRLTLLFPYTHGYWLSYFEARGLLDDPPISTEQVLHGAKRHEPFLAIDLAALRPSLPSGCRVLHENTVGELGLSVLFRELAESPDTASWEGWHGDRYLAASCDGRREFVWVSAWDSEADAREFAEAYRLVADQVALRAELGEPPRVSRTGSEVRVLTRGLEPLRRLLDRAPRRRPVASLSQLRAHFGGPSSARAPGSARSRLEPLPREDD